MAVSCLPGAGREALPLAASTVAVGAGEHHTERPQETDRSARRCMGRQAKGVSARRAPPVPAGRPGHAAPVRRSRRSGGLTGVPAARGIHLSAQQVIPRWAEVPRLLCRRRHPAADPVHPQALHRRPVHPRGSQRASRPRRSRARHPHRGSPITASGSSTPPDPKAVRLAREYARSCPCSPTNCLPGPTSHAARQDSGPRPAARRSATLHGHRSPISRASTLGLWPHWVVNFRQYRPHRRVCARSRARSAWLAGFSH
jgi:hypothetical protein